MKRPELRSTKVFCVGWHKTGTTSMGWALHRLGYRVLGARLDMAEHLIAGRTDEVVGVLAEFDACQDVPWAALYRQLDETYPGSKFILTTRDEQAWLTSASNHFGGNDIPLHRWLYGQGEILGNETLYLERYRRHNREVRDYFADRPGDFLEIDLATAGGWPALCRFLDRPVPRRRFPHVNKVWHKQTAMEKAPELIKRNLPRPMLSKLSDLKWFVLGLFGVQDERDVFHNKAQNQKEIARYRGLQ